MGDWGSRCHAACGSHAVIQLTKCYAEAFGGAGVRVNCGAPGMIESEMLRKVVVLVVLVVLVVVVLV